MENISKSIPTLSALLIFIGYLNYYFYYSCFDIEIDSFLTTSELIFSFLPLTIPFLLTIGSLVFLSIGANLAIGQPGKDLEKSDNETALHSISRVRPAWSRMIKHLSKSDKTFIDWITLPVSFFVFVLSIGVTIFMISYIFIFIYASKTSDFVYVSYSITLFLGFLWMVFIFIRIDLGDNQEIKTKYKNLAYALLVILSIGLLRISNKENAFEVLKGRPKYHVVIETGDAKISSDSTVVYIGQTANFIFLRNRKSSSNLIIKTSDIKTFTLTKIKKSK